MYGKYPDDILSFYVATFFNGIVLLMADKNLIIRICDELDEDEYSIPCPHEQFWIIIPVSTTLFYSLSIHATRYEYSNVGAVRTKKTRYLRKREKT